MGVPQIYLLIDYDEHSREDINVIGCYSTFSQAEEVGKLLLREQLEENVRMRQRVIEEDEEQLIVTFTEKQIQT